MRRFVNVQNIFKVILFLFVGLSQGACKGELEEPPVELRVESLSVGEVYSFKVMTEERRDYAVYIYFYARYPNTNWLFSRFEKSYIREEREKLLDMFPKRESLGATAAYRETRAKFKVKITDLKSDEIILDAVVDRPKSNDSAGGRYSILVEKNMSPGQYKIDVLYLEGDPGLASLRARFVFYDAPRGK